MYKRYKNYITSNDDFAEDNIINLQKEQNINKEEKENEKENNKKTEEKINLKKVIILFRF